MNTDRAAYPPPYGGSSYSGLPPEPPSNPMGTVSLVCGVLALLSWGCCCCSSVIPFAGFLAMALTFILSAVALGAGIAGRSRARERGLDTTASTFGAVLGLLNLLGLLAWFVMVVAFGGMAVLANILEQAR